MSTTTQQLVVAAAVLFLQATANGQTAPETADRLVQLAESALAAGHPWGAIQACAETLRRFPDDVASHTCTKELEPNLKDVVSAAAALVAAGDAEAALERCAAVLVLSPTDKEATSCASTARARIAAHDRDRLTLEQARGFVAAGEHARASQNLGELAKSEFTDILKGSLELQDALNRKTTAQVDLTARAAIAHAKLIVEYGRQDEGVKMLQDVLTSNASSVVRDEALRALSDARPSLRRAYLETMHHPWAVELLAMLSVIAGVWFGLHWMRDLWRWIVARVSTGPGGRWKFAGMVGDDPLGARDPILDALRRVPHEVHKPIWTPTRLILYPYHNGWDVWEDFCIAKKDKAKVVHENVFDMSVQQSGGDRVLSDAFQNLQFTVGNVGVSAVTKFWAGLVEWWHTGEPSFSATAQDVGVPDGGHVIIRLSATGPAGTASVLATHDRQSGVDAVSLCADRAAYKLLFTMSDHRDSAAQIDGHAAFRQGVTSLSRSVRAVVDTKMNKEEREGHIFTAIHNLEVARRSFERDRDHPVYHLQSLRFLAIAYALVGRDVAARTVLEELEDRADQPFDEEGHTPSHPETKWKRAQTAFCAFVGVGASKVPEPSGPTPAQKEAARKRNQQLKVEAQYNQAMLYCHMVAEEGDEARASLALAFDLMDNVTKLDPTLADSVRVWRLLHLNNISWPEWRSLDAKEIRSAIEGGRTMPQELDRRAAEAVGADRRYNSLLAAHARRNLGVARLRYLAAFDLLPRFPFIAPGQRLTPKTLEEVRSAFDFIGASALLGPLSPRAALARAYGLLLLSKWSDAERAAREVLDADKTDQFALYVAAEAALQRDERTVALQYVRTAQLLTIVDPALRAFVDASALWHERDAIAALDAGSITATAGAAGRP